MDFFRNPGFRLKAIRNARSLSQDELAATAPFSKTTVSSWETLDKLPSGKNLEIVADRLGVTPIFLQSGIPWSCGDATVIKDLQLQVPENLDPAHSYRSSVYKQHEKSGSSVMETQSRIFTDTGFDSENKLRNTPDELELIADPKNFPNDARSAGVLEDVRDLLTELWDLSKSDPDTAAVVRFLIENHVDPKKLVRK